MSRILVPLVLLLFCMFSSSALFAQSNLPKQVQADLLLAEIQDNLQAEEYDAALRDLEEYLALGVPIAPKIYVLAAKVYVAVGDNEEALSAVREYFGLPDISSEPEYRQVLSLYRGLTENVEGTFWQQRLQVAEGEYDQGHFSTAIALLKAGLSERSEEHDLRNEADRRIDRYNVARKSAENDVAWKILGEMRFVQIPGGTFTLGGNSQSRITRTTSNRTDDRIHSLPAKPTKKMTLEPFWMGATEVTIGTYRLYAEVTGDFSGLLQKNDHGNFGSELPREMRLALIRAIPKNPKPYLEYLREPDRPLIVDFFEGTAVIERFCAWLIEKTGDEYSLPSEAQWEYAARAGTDIKFPWGNEFVAGKAQCCGSSTDPIGVANFEPNSFGLHDMAGNASELVADVARYKRSWKSFPPRRGYGDVESNGSPYEDGFGHIVRGGDARSTPHELETRYRGGSKLFEFVGFRLVRRASVPAGSAESRDSR